MRFFTLAVPALLRTNVSFRRLWLSQLISNFGDWFGLLAGYSIILKHSGSEALLGALIITKMLSFAAFSPFGGYFADRFSRRKLMILTDIGRAVIVLSFIASAYSGWLWILFAGTALQMFMGAVFEPSRSAILPDLVAKPDLANANVISSATWSVVFAVGMGIGGLATEWLGTTAVFLLDAATYLVSAWFIARIPEPETMRKAAQEKPLQGIIDGFRYLKSHAPVRAPVLVKAASSLFLGALVYALVLVGERKLHMGTIGIGLLYMARGVGTAFGPGWGRRLFPDKNRWLSAFGVFFVTGGITYALCGLTASLWVLLLLVFIAHAASAAGWVLSTVLVQERADEAYRGRVFGMEWLSFTVFNSASTAAASTLMEAGLLSLNAVMFLFGGLLATLGLVWMLLMHRNGEASWWAGGRSATAGNSVSLSP
jgi:MFS family permease